MLEFRLLGPLEVLIDGRAVTPTRQKQRALLAVLALHAGTVLSADRLVDELWGEHPPPTAKGSLQNLVSSLRKMLGRDVLQTRDRGYVLDVKPESIDARCFERHVEEALDAPATRRAARLRDALSLWRGPALGDLASERFGALEAGRLEELRLIAEEELFEARLDLGEDAELVPQLEVLVTEHPLRERPRRQLMLALYRAGRQAEALAAYQEARRTLLDELGLEPSPGLRDLQQAILRQDESLLLPGRLPEEERRKVVTVVSADVVNADELGERLDAEVFRDVIERAFAAIRAAVEYHGGRFQEFASHHTLAVFGVPMAHEDDALRAVRAAADARRNLAAVNEELERERQVRVDVRTAVNTGEVVTAERAPSALRVTGDAVALAKRLEQAADPGDILLGTATLRLVRDAVRAEPLEPLPMRGQAKPVAAYRFRQLRADAPAIARRLDAPLVGRAGELAELRRAFDRARHEHRSVFRALVGDAGIGKTRLATELCLELDGSATAVVGRCVSYGEGATWLPLVEVLRSALGDRPVA
ncbi:MAG: winged helix-turn-helix domain-containing protein, partial [Actinomycetota bacterium]|nr:winged helix-turn-helix domain-containing protein [Actinomycetota bacterium]